MDRRLHAERLENFKGDLLCLNLWLGFQPLSLSGSLCYWFLTTVDRLRRATKSGEARENHSPFSQGVYHLPHERDGGDSRIPSMVFA